jgi:hypothetical protein
MSSPSTFLKVSPVTHWIISRLARQNSVTLTTLSDEYANERAISVPSARRVLYRHIKSLLDKGIVERLDTYPVSYKLKKLPLEFVSQSSKDFQTSHIFDLSLGNHISTNLLNPADLKQKLQELIHELRKTGLRLITRVNSFRQKALLMAQREAIGPGTRPHADIAFLHGENMKAWSSSVLAFMNDEEQTMTMPVRTRFNDSEKALMILLKSKKALKNAFKDHKDALMITLTLPRLFPLVLPVDHEGQIFGYVPLQDSIITKLKSMMMDWLRKMWKDRKIETFTAYEYHTDYTLHVHVLVFGIPYLINWSRKVGSKKEDALTYYSHIYNIKMQSRKKTKVSKHIFTALLDKWLQKILVRFGSALKINLLDAYLHYKQKEKLQGPVNEIHRIKNGEWVVPPKDSVIEYSSGAAYQKVIGPDQYVLKYVTKIVDTIAQGGSVQEKDQAKVFGYWLFGKRFNSFSPSLLPRASADQDPKWHFLGVFNLLNLPDYIINNLVIDLTGQIK